MEVVKGVSRGGTLYAKVEGRANTRCGKYGRLRGTETYVPRIDLRARAGSPPDTSSLKQSYVIVYHEACGESLLIDSYVLYMIYTRLVQSLHDYFLENDRVQLRMTVNVLEMGGAYRFRAYSHGSQYEETGSAVSDANSDANFDAPFARTSVV